MGTFVWDGQDSVFRFETGVTVSFGQGYWNVWLPGGVKDGMGEEKLSYALSRAARWKAA